MKKLLKSLRGKALPLKKSRKVIRDAGLFQQDWYLDRYPDVVRSKHDPLDHYILEGEKLGYWPNPYFDPAWYLKNTAAARRSKLIGLLHYELEGWKKDKKPSEHFSSSLYREQYPDALSNGAQPASPLSHFLTRGRYEGKIAFHSHLETLDQAEQLIRDMLTIHESGMFSGTWYKEFYVGLWSSDIDPLFHYVNEGHGQNKKPNPVFETSWYRWQHPEEIGFENPFVHFIEKGEKEGHDPSSDFCTKTYYKQNPELIRGKDSALQHYLTHSLPKGEPRPQPGAEKPSSGKKLSASAKLPLHTGLRGMIDFEAKELAPDSSEYKSSKLKIHWVIPDFAAGGGGHMTIFRMAHFLEYYGHKQTFWINDPSIHKTEEKAQDTILKHFQQFTGKVKFLDKRFKKAKGDIVIATDCWTVWPILSATNFKRRFYFVQDFEPSFHAMGSLYLAAEETYKQDIDCICASPWLEKLMQEKYGRWARSFWLAADTALYHPVPKLKENKRPRIAFYARHFTARRAVELGMLALEELAKRGVDFEVDFFGAPLEFKQAPFRYKDHGVASPEELAAIFQQADVGVVFSATNYSLVPQEMMACGLPIVELDGDNTRSIFPPEVVSFAQPHPAKIADAIEALTSSTKKRQQQSKAAREWVQKFKWEDAAKTVETALLERLAEFGTDSKPKPTKKYRTSPKASVVIPTYNAGPVLDKVLSAATTQRTPWPFEILVIDSGSTDETLDIIAKYPDVRLHSIDKSEFNHGDTRNLGVKLTEGEFVAFLTHDAMPANANWLYNLVTSLEMNPKAAGAFGKHLAYPEASPYTVRDMNAHFSNLLNYPLYLDKDTNTGRFNARDQQWMQLLHFYSDNNSCMRRSVWEKIPYRPVKFGEDQVWADDIIKAGYGKVYAPRAMVYHSHDFEPAEHQERNMTEAAFFKHFFGYALIKNRAALEQTLADLNKNDEAWGKDKGVNAETIAKQKALNEARLLGYLEGYQADTTDMF
ncbi:MAG: glycosyltransferase [Kordiimonas sp.]